MNGPVGNFELGMSFGQKRLDVTEQSHSGPRRKNHPGPVDGGARMIILRREAKYLRVVGRGEMSMILELFP